MLNLNKCLRRGVILQDVTAKQVFSKIRWLAVVETKQVFRIFVVVSKLSYKGVISNSLKVQTQFDWWLQVEGLETTDQCFHFVWKVWQLPSAHNKQCQYTGTNYKCFSKCLVSSTAPGESIGPGA